MDSDYLDHIFVGSDAGVFYSEDGGQGWGSLNEGIYNAPVMAMKIHPPTRTLVIGTYGLSAFRLNLDDLTTSVPDNSESKVDKVRLEDLPDLSPGIYYIHLLDKAGKTIAKEKVIKL